MNLSSSFNEREFKQAVEWFVRLQVEQCPAEDRLRFESWLAKHASHRAAYAEAERVWANMDDLKTMPVPGLAEARSARPRKSSALPLSSLAFIMLAATLLGGAWLEYSAETITYATRMGEHRRIELADNSRIDLNTDTRVSVKISLLQRSVVLTQGEALFEVSHSRLRPFTVQVGDLRIRDVGTRFNVLKNAQGAMVSVLEGEVKLNDGKKVIDEHLNAGNQRSYTETSGLGALKTVEFERLTAWVNGQLVFKHTPLREVAAELERYTRCGLLLTIPKSRGKRSAALLAPMILNRFCMRLKISCLSGRHETDSKFCCGKLGKSRPANSTLSHFIPAPLESVRRGIPWPFASDNAAY